jgi:hypothetical protein
LRSVIAGGHFNQAEGQGSIISGGTENYALGFHSTISGGLRNSATGSFATVPGGNENAAAGAYSLAAGHRAIAQHEGSFVWADNSGDVLGSEEANSVTIRAAGGYRLSAMRIPRQACHSLTTPPPGLSSPTAT